MSARAPFVPQRPASRAADAASDSATTKSPGASHEPFRPTGLLDSPAPSSAAGSQAANGSEDKPKVSTKTADSASHGFASKFKPLNLSGLSKKKGDVHPSTGSSHASAKSRQSIDGSSSSVSSSRSFSASHQARLSDHRPVSPFFPSSRGVSANQFRAPTAPPQITRADEFSSNSAHIVSSFTNSDLGDSTDALRHSSGAAVERHRVSHPLDSSFGSHRSRTASQPSLASIHEVAEEDEALSPEKGSADYSAYADSFGQGHTLSGSFEDASQAQQGLRRSIKRNDREEDGDDEYAFGTGAKRYKPDAAYQHELAASYDGHAASMHLPVPEYSRAMTPAHGVPLLVPAMHFVQEPVKTSDAQSASRQALYQLLGQDLDIFVEANADSYEQARKKWAECSVEEWTKGADDIATRFGRMLDYVKDHMT
ncbi:hypothetical protein FKP32DRAFT_1591015 [Trametes sanguinea]|nr:hypothetical protein FKP32DRAFT_1591015 [Trametes sanguinea]